MLFKSVLMIGLVVLSSQLYAKEADTKLVPISGAFNGYLLPLNENPDAIALRCNPPEGKFAWAIASLEGWGTMSHLGDITWYAEHCSYGTIGIGPDGTFGEGELTFIGDNGDELMATYTHGFSLSPPPLVVIMDQLTFVDGGTGRFTHASGEGSETGVLNFNDSSFTSLLNGVISYKR